MGHRPKRNSFCGDALFFYFRDYSLAFRSYGTKKKVTTKQFSVIITIKSASFPIGSGLRLSPAATEREHGGPE